MGESFSVSFGSSAEVDRRNNWSFRWWFGSSAVAGQLLVKTRDLVNFGGALSACKVARELDLIKLDNSTQLFGTRG